MRPQLRLPESDADANTSENEGLRNLRRHLASAVLARLCSEVPTISAHFGEDYENTDEPEAVVYRRTGGTFRFLAFAFAPWRMWDLHIGVVPLTESRLSVGFHISERAADLLMADLQRLAANIGTTVIHQKAAVEYQANLAPVPTNGSNTDAVANTIVDLCRQFASVAKKVPCPTSMATQFEQETEGDRPKTE